MSPPTGWTQLKVNRQETPDAVWISQPLEAQGSKKKDEDRPVGTWKCSATAAFLKSFCLETISTGC